MRTDVQTTHDGISLTYMHSIARQKWLMLEVKLLYVTQTKLFIGNVSKPAMTSDDPCHFRISRLFYV